MNGIISEKVLDGPKQPLDNFSRKFRQSLVPGAEDNMIIPFADPFQNVLSIIRNLNRFASRFDPGGKVLTEYVLTRRTSSIENG